MLAPLSWLKDYVDIDVTPKELEEKLFSCGFEVEELIEVGKDISNVVVGLVESCEPIPDTHLSLCQVNAGEHGTFQICCGGRQCPCRRKISAGACGRNSLCDRKGSCDDRGRHDDQEGKASRL